jgi:hypothetical protein
MKEQILEIIERPIRQTGWDEFGNPICNDYSNKASEIDTLTKEHYMRFAEWFRRNTEINDNITPFYFLYSSTGKVGQFSVDEVYKYWNEYINKDK